MKRVFRTLPKRGQRITKDPRVEFLHVDASGFTIVQADVELGESVCWRCATIAHDPDGKLRTCPSCGGDFND